MGIHVNEIKEQLSSQGFSNADVLNAVSSLSNEGYIYSTVDENHYQFAA